MDRVVTIEIFGQHYKIRVKGEENEQYISQLTSYVDRKMNEVAVKSRSSDVAKIAVLAAMNIADELFLSHKDMDQLSEAIGRLETELESLEDQLHKNEHTFSEMEKVSS